MPLVTTQVIPILSHLRCGKKPKNSTLDTWVARSIGRTVLTKGSSTRKLAGTAIYSQAIGVFWTALTTNELNPLSRTGQV